MVPDRRALVLHAVLLFGLFVNSLFYLLQHVINWASAYDALDAPLITTFDEVPTLSAGAYFFFICNTHQTEGERWPNG